MRPRLSHAVLAFLLPIATTACDSSDRAPPPPRERTAEARLAACDFGPGVPGLDVSTYQGTIDWPTVAADGWKFAIARIGHFGLDDQFEANWAGIKAAGMVRGGYQYFEPSDDPLEQAQVVIDAVGRLGPGDLPVTCDVESDDLVDPATYEAVLAVWMDAVEEGTGKRPMIYTRASYWDPYVDSDAFSDSVLWVAHYTTTQCPNVPQDWPDWTFWQWTDSGQVPGMPDASAVDQNYFHGTEEELLALANGGSYAATLDGIDLPSTVLAGETFGVTVTFTNSGGESWDSATFLGTSEPRDRESEFEAPTWVAPNRPAVVAGIVAPGATYAFELELLAPEAPGAYVEDFALVQEGVTWFADAGGPADDAVHLSIQVVERETGSTGGGPGDGGASADDDDGDDDDDDDDGDAPSAAAGVGGEDEVGAGGDAPSEGASDDGCAVRGADRGRGAGSALALAAMCFAAALARRSRGGEFT